MLAAGCNKVRNIPEWTVSVGHHEKFCFLNRNWTIMENRWNRHVLTIRSPGVAGLKTVSEHQNNVWYPWLTHKVRRDEHERVEE